MGVQSQAELGMYADRLRLELTLTVGGDAFALPGGCIKRFVVDADSTGFDAELFFVISAEQVKDELQPEFVKPDAVSVKLSIEPVDSMADPEPLVLRGYATAKSMVEVVGEGVTGVAIIAIIVISSLMAVVYIWRIVEAAYFGEGEVESVSGEAPLPLLLVTWVAVLLNFYFGLMPEIPVELATSAAQLLQGDLP